MRTLGLLAAFAVVGTVAGLAAPDGAEAVTETHDGYVCWYLITGDDESTALNARIYSGPGCTGSYNGSFFVWGGNGTDPAQYQRLHDAMLEAVSNDLHVVAVVDVFNVFGSTLRYLDRVTLYSN